MSFAAVVIAALRVNCMVKFLLLSYLEQGRLSLYLIKKVSIPSLSSANTFGLKINLTTTHNMAHKNVLYVFVAYTCVCVTAEVVVMRLHRV